MISIDAGQRVEGNEINPGRREITLFPTGRG
jgi:hypothetical protein